MKTFAFGLALCSALIFAASQGFAAGQDEAFIHDAAQFGIAEVEAGKLADQKAQSSEVKRFANTMVADHTKANDELKQIAQGKAATAPARTGETQETELSRLRKLSGAEFDRAYMKEQVSDHQKTISIFEKEANNGSDPDLKAFAQKTLPILRRHLDLAQSLASKVS